MGVAPPNLSDVPAGTWLGETKHRDTWARLFQGDRLRHEADAETGCHQFDDEIDLTTPRGDIRFETVSPAPLQDDPVDSEAFTEQDEGDVAKRRQIMQAPLSQKLEPPTNPARFNPFRRSEMSASRHDLLPTRHRQWAIRPRVRPPRGSASLPHQGGK